MYLEALTPRPLGISTQQDGSFMERKRTGNDVIQKGKSRVYNFFVDFQRETICLYGMMFYRYLGMYGARYKT